MQKSAICFISIVSFFLVPVGPITGQDKISFSTSDRSPGLTKKSELDTVFNNNIKITRNDKELAQQETKRTEKLKTSCKLLEAENGEVKKYKLTVDEISVKNESSSENGGDQQKNGEDETPPVDGNTYIITLLEEDEMKIEREGDTDISKEEEDFISNQVYLDHKNKWKDTLEGKSLEKGDTVETTENILDIMPDDEDLEEISVDTLELTYTGSETTNGRKTGNFDLIYHLTMEFQSKGNRRATDMTMELELEGTVAVDRDTCLPVSLELEGPVSVEGKQTVQQKQQRMELNISGEGSATINGSGEISTEDTGD